ncbi:hypothetical protein DV452_000155 [Geotrichum candidum]|nr:hypothetical protein DV452_000155 [Geotrichum candidum]
MNSHAQLYAVVKHEFNPERADELQASVGESIIIIARSNQEWVVAKPIGRLGGPGLIPINFIEIRDIGTNKPVSDLNDALNRAHVPYVEEWKRLAAEYKASSIPLGKIDDLAENMAISGPPEQVEEPQSYQQQPQTQEPQQLEEQTQPNISTDTTTAPVQESADLDQDPTINLLSQSEAEPTETNFSVASPVNSASKGTTAPGDEQAAEAQPPVAERAVKIKIFHEDDLIAVRVLNTIPLAELSAKITERLQLSSVVLLHKDEASGTFTELNSDADLQRALGNKVKLVLNAK